MQNISHLTEDLINAIHTSDEYLKYKNAKQIIDNNIDIKNRITAFKKKRIQSELKFQNGIDISQVENKEIQDIYMDLMLDENINIYLTYEKIIVNTITDLYSKIVDSIDINLECMD